MDGQTFEVIAKGVVGSMGILLGLWIVLSAIKWGIRLFAQVTDKGLERSARLAGKATTKVLEVGAKLKSAYDEGRRE